MVHISFLKPTDQPTGTLRILDELRSCLENPHFNRFRMVVAFAKIGALLRLEESLLNAKKRGASLHAILGVDQQGTSRQALEFAMEVFDDAFVAHIPKGSFNPTFHPKIYLFDGKERGLAYIGSNNMTVGGLETNSECATKIAFSSCEEDALLASLNGLWDDALQVSAPLDESLLHYLCAKALVVDEAQMRSSTSQTGKKKNEQEDSPFPGIKVVAPSAIPKSTATKWAKEASKKKPAAKKKAKPVSAPLTMGSKALVIQIVPHHNGEVFLSKRAVDQDPAFFGWPFTGQTTPKKRSNASYPQRIPDPVVDLKVFDSKGAMTVHLPDFCLNTVYYSTKSEIRITVRPEVVAAVPTKPPYPIMLMQTAEDNYDYDIEIYNPGSSEYEQLLRCCNQNMPTGGKSVARKFGWI